VEHRGGAPVRGRHGAGAGQGAGTQGRRGAAAGQGTGPRQPAGMVSGRGLEAWRPAWRRGTERRQLSEGGGGHARRRLGEMAEAPRRGTAWPRLGSAKWWRAPTGGAAARLAEVAEAPHGGTAGHRLGVVAEAPRGGTAGRRLGEVGGGERALARRCARRLGEVGEVARAAEGARSGMVARRLGEVAERQHGGVGGARAAARPGGEGVAPVRVRVWCGGRQSKRLSVGRVCLPCVLGPGTRQTIFCKFF